MQWLLCRSCDFLPYSGNKMLVALGLHSNSIELHTLEMSATHPDHAHTSTVSAPGHRTDIRYFFLHVLYARACTHTNNSCTFALRMHLE